MKVGFTRTGERRYRVTIERPGEPPRHMEPAPGYHDRLPHDAAHFIVENELKILGGIFGQMAAGGIIGPNEADARQRRRSKKQRNSLMKENRDDALFSEHAVYAAQSRWEKHEIIPDTKIPPADLARIAEKFEQFAAQWSALPIGGSITLEWHHDAPKRKH